METLDLDIAVPLRSFELDVELSIGRETVALVGPSGAGKSTLLRAVAGLHTPARGRIALGGRTWFDAAARVDLPPEARAVGLVFQEYALFPHMTVRRNVAFGGTRRVDELLARLRIAHLADARPGAISGGERQRVALARALSREPGVLLLDEPLAALDAHTRGAVRAELQDILAQIALPTIIVTHDFGDASALADRIGVIVDGRLRQLATTAELVARPADAFVATFTGAGVLPGHARSLPGGGSEVRLDRGDVVHSSGRADGRIAVALYPWELSVTTTAPAADGLNVIPGAVVGLAPEGDRVRVRVGDLVAECDLDEAERLGLERGTPAFVLFGADAARLVAAAPRPPGG